MIDFVEWDTRSVEIEFMTEYFFFFRLCASNAMTITTESIPTLHSINEVLINSVKIRLKIAQIERILTTSSTSKCEINLYAIDKNIHKCISIKELITRKYLARFVKDTARISLTENGAPRIDLKLEFSCE